MRTPSRKLKVGIVGCGNISGIYFHNFPKFEAVDCVACADLDLARARASAEKHDVPLALSVEDLLASPEVDIVVNLTVPAAHSEVAFAALRAGKSVYNEKPLAVRSEDAAEMLRLAAEKGLRVGGAPDTFLGAALQTCRQLIDEGAIGEPVGASAFMLGRGPERWHPNPDFFYQHGAGPLFDMGPYYLTALASLLGPVRRVSGSARASFPERTIGGPVRTGEKIKVETPTHLAAVLDFAAGPIATLVTSWDVAATNFRYIEVYGSEASMVVPNPNHFTGDVMLRRFGQEEWTTMPLTHIYTENMRGVGVADMAQAILDGRPHRANGEMASHVLEIMHAVHQASLAGEAVKIKSHMERPAPLPPGLLIGQI